MSNKNTQVPKKSINGITFFPVPEFTDLDMAFGADESKYFNRHDLPEVPSEYEDMAGNLIYKGGRLPDLAPQVDKSKAMKAIRAWLSSFAPAHEAKLATVGYALWLWTNEDALK